MNPHADARPSVDATSDLSADGQLDETARNGAPGDGTAVGKFGPPAAPGEVGTLGPYRIVKELGKGGMGAVYAAVDNRLDRKLALKVMLRRQASDGELQRFLQEARVLGQLAQSVDVVGQAFV